MDDDTNRHEQGLAAFIAARRRSRFTAALARGGTARAKELARLHRGPDLDPRWIVDAGALSTAGRGANDLLHALAEFAPGVTRAHIVSGDADLDGTTHDLATALRLSTWTDESALLSLVPGRVAVYAGELADDVLILHRDPRH